MTEKDLFFLFKVISLLITNKLSEKLKMSGKRYTQLSLAGDAAGELVASSELPTVDYALKFEKERWTRVQNREQMRAGDTSSFLVGVDLNRDREAWQVKTKWQASQA